MRTILPILFVISFSFISCNSKAQKEHTSNKEQSSINTPLLLLAPKDFEVKLLSEENPQLIDVRTSSEFDSGTILYAKNYDYLNGAFQEALKDLDKHKATFVFCAKGSRSGKASKLLEDNGFTHIIDLDGGYSAWREFKQ